ncbi:MAG: protein adenylyltransferase SelO [Bosea sp. (in: a-proteobacteria)]
MTTAIAFDNSYARLPPRFFEPTLPTPVSKPRLVRLNRALALELGLDPDWLGGEAGVAMLAGNAIADGSTPIAAAYAGHQFGHFVPQLGDGRAILLGEVIDRNGARRDIQLKGAGRTRFSRGGDGRAALGPVMREYLVSEAMAAFGIPTTRALAFVTTGEAVVREQFLPGAILTRVASSHIRVGSFQFFAARRDVEGIRTLADHVIARHYPDCALAENRYLALLSAVIEAQARLVAQWLLVGFIHGVMNTDNMSVAGETIDYGPCAFMEAYDTDTVFSAIDVNGRYAYGAQPSIALWNLTRLAETLAPLLATQMDQAVALAQEALERFGPAFTAAYESGLASKLGLTGSDPADDGLIGDWLQLLARHQADFTLHFRSLADAAESEAGRQRLRERFAGDPAIDAWLSRWRARIAPGDAAARLRQANPVYIPRNHLVEAAIAAAVGSDDFRPFESLTELLSQPYRDRSGFEAYALPAKAEERVLRTFCGT